MPLHPEERAELRSILVQRRAGLRAETRAEALSSGECDPTELLPDVRDAGDEALAIQISDFNIRVLEQEMRALRETDAALARIEEGTYGVCADCGGDIPVARLRAYPSARRCTPCQARRELQRGRRDPSPSL